MFLLGHSCWSYLISKTTATRLHTTLPAYLALLSGVLPDFDIYFHPFIEHHTYTHSILTLGPASILLARRYGRTGIAFSAGLLSHLLTDGLVGTIPILYPLTTTTIGLNLGIPGIADSVLETGAVAALLETGALALTVAYAIRNKDYKQFTSPDMNSLPLTIPLAAIVSLSVLFAGDYNISLTAFAFSRRALTLISIGHIILGAILALGTLQGLRAQLRKQTTADPPHNADKT